MNARDSADTVGRADGTIDRTAVVALAALTLVVALYFAPRGFQVGFVDMGHDGYQLRQVLDLSRGGVIFRDTFDQYGPLNGYINLVGFLAFGRRLLAVKYFICLWYALIAVVLYAMARRWLEPPLAAFSGLLWLGLAPFYNHGVMISPHAYVLLFQAVATLIALRSPDLSPGRYALIGLFAGLSWAVKQSMGALYLLAILTFLLLQLLRGRADLRRAAGAAASSSLAFAAVVGIALALLWRFGALGDWYLQTFVFPREFYLAASEPAGGAVLRAIEPVVAFVQLQWGQPLYWLIVRAVVLITAANELIRGRHDDDLLLIAVLTAFLWLGAYPSGNFMHQWWTASLTFAPFVGCVRRLITYRAGGARAAWATVALITVLVVPGLVDRWQSTVTSIRTLTETIAEPPVLRGIRTDPPTRRALEMLYGVMARYRSEHPAAGVVSIEAADGWRGGIIESLTFLSFFQDNPRPQPVYWSLPVLSTTVYPRYGEVLWRQVRKESPLIVEHYTGKYRAIRVSGYRLLAAAQSDYGHWYIYAPVGTGASAEPPTYLASDGAVEEAFPADEIPALAKRLNPGQGGGWRGRVVTSPRRDGVVRVTGEYPLKLVDPAFVLTSGPVNVYTWPADLPEATIHGSIEPTPTDVVWRAGRGDIVRELRPGSWTVQGNAPRRYAYLLQWGKQPIEKGSSFVVRGELFEGGLQIGFLENDEWVSYVAVTNIGPFEAVIEIQKSGTYALVLANCITSSWSERAWRHPIGGLLSLWGRANLPNRFHVSQAGWVGVSS